MAKAVIFDLDNTLYEYDPAHKNGLKESYKILKKEINISFKKFSRLYKISREEVHRELAGTASSHSRVIYFQRLIEKTHDTIEPEVISKLHKTYWRAYMKKMKLRKGVIKTLLKSKEVYFYNCGGAILPEPLPDCIPCFKETCERGKNCMEDITVEKVYKSILNQNY